jgi:hypothetical protein
LKGQMRTRSLERPLKGLVRGLEGFSWRETIERPDEDTLLLSGLGRGGNRGRR